jgi:hypothetical protein
MIGRISAANPQTTNEAARAFGFAGKLFPTTDPTEPVVTANFFTVNDLNGTLNEHALAASYVNEPPVDFNAGLSGFVLRILNSIFALADINPGVRPVYPIAHAGETGHAVTPKWMRIQAALGSQSPHANDADFRNELSAKNYPEGLTFTIDVSDTTKDTSAKTGWQRLGKIRTSAMLTTFGCDRRLHFHHPRFTDPHPN